jgi:hypothetical protein
MFPSRELLQSALHQTNFWLRSATRPSTETVDKPLGLCNDRRRNLGKSEGLSWACRLFPRGNRLWKTFRRLNFCSSPHRLRSSNFDRRWMQTAWTEVALTKQDLYDERWRLGWESKQPAVINRCPRSPNLGQFFGQSRLETDSFYDSSACCTCISVHVSKLTIGWVYAYLERF